MRLLSGLILGILLTIGVAFVSDAWTSGPETNGGSTSAQHRTMVNWDVVGENLHIVSQRAREAWSRLSHKVTG